MNTNSVVVAVERTLTSLSPRSWASVVDAVVGHHVYEPLVAYDASVRIVGRLARSWEVLDGGRAWRFSLAPGRTFHDGRPVDSVAVMAAFGELSIRRMGLSSFLESMSADGPQALVFRLRRPFAPLLDRLANPFAVVAPPGDGGLVPPGSGPYVHDRRSEDGRVHLLRRPAGGAEDRRGIPGEISFVPALGGVEMWRALVDRRADAAYEVPYAVAAGRERHAHVTVRTSPSLSVNTLTFNTRDPALSSLAVRRRVAELVDRQELLTSVHEGVGTIPSGPVPPASPFYVARGARDEAASVAAEPGARGTLPSRLELLATEGTTPAFLTVLRDQFARNGVELAVRLAPFAKLMLDVHFRRFQIVLLGMATSADPDLTMYGSFHSVGGKNVCGLMDAEYDALVERAREEASIETRTELYALATARLESLSPAVFLRHGLSIAAHASDLEGIVATPMNILDASRAVRLAGKGFSANAAGDDKAC